MSESSITMSDSQDTATATAAVQAQKRKASVAGLDAPIQQTRSVKRRASKACQCCRARKVRCNVTEHGAPCTNCRLDEVECIVSESRRKKKWSRDDEVSAESRPATTRQPVTTQNRRATITSRVGLDGLHLAASVASRRSHESDHDEHVPHPLYQAHGHRMTQSLNYGPINRRLSSATPSPACFLPGRSPLSVDATLFQNFTPQVAAGGQLPCYIKPLPARIGPDEIAYLEKKGALTIPTNGLRDELLKSYIEYVHPYMPLLDLYDFVQIIDSGNGTFGRISLILFQAVMFAGSAFVEMRHLQAAGYVSRKEARKDLFQRTRLLYDFDYESDRVSLVQALLLLTYYYETPDDQKDTWHWMGVATSVAHTIGLHRNPQNSSMDSRRTKLWKRIWWSTYMRDRLIALGMRRPTRIKSEDYDVPMLTLDDFEIVEIPESVSCVPSDCILARDVQKQKELAIMCIEKAKLCLCISQVLSKQYCVLNNNQGMLNDRTTMMLLPKKLTTDTNEVKACDDALVTWFEDLPPEAQRSETSSGDPVIDLHTSLLHMVYYTTLSALHRPQVLPSANAPVAAASDLLETSRRNVRLAASAITDIATQLDALGLVRFLPTTGVTVLLPAIIIHLLDIKAPEEHTRRASLKGFCQCMTVMGKLRDCYAAADFSTAFLEAAIRKAGIHIAPFPNNPSFSKPEVVMSVDDLVSAGRRMDLVNMGVNPDNMSMANRTLTPPPDNATTGKDANRLDLTAVTDEEVARRLESFLASTPPNTDPTADGQIDGDKGHSAWFGSGLDFDQDDFDQLLNLDALCEGMEIGTGADWIKSIA